MKAPRAGYDLRTLGLCWLVLQCALVCRPAIAQEAGETPGALPDPGTYKGSMQLQEEEHRRDQQGELENQQMQQRLNATYEQYAPQPGTGRQGNGVRLVDWWSKPALAPERNPLLGRWKQVPSKGIESQGAGGVLAGLDPRADALVASMVNGTMAGGCKSMFGTGVVAFEPTALQWVAPDGHEEILNNVAYRANGIDVVVVTRDPGAVPALFFGLPNHDHAVVALFNCTMDRVGAQAPTGSGTPSAVPTQARSAAPAVAPPRAADAWLDFQVGATAQGKFTPFDGIQIWVMPQDPQTALGQILGESAGSASERLAADCREPLNCARDWKVMSAKALGSVSTDATGHAKTPSVASGRYYLVGHAAYQGTWLFWHLPVDLHAGANAVTLDQTNASLMK